MCMGTIADGIFRKQLGAFFTHNIVAVRQGEVVVVVSLLLLRLQKACGSLRLCLAEQGDRKSQRAKARLRLGDGRGRIGMMAWVNAIIHIE